MQNRRYSKVMLDKCMIFNLVRCNLYINWMWCFCVVIWSCLLWVDNNLVFFPYTTWLWVFLSLFYNRSDFVAFKFEMMEIHYWLNGCLFWSNCNKKYFPTHSTNTTICNQMCFQSSFFIETNPHWNNAQLKYVNGHWTTSVIQFPSI